MFLYVLCFVCGVKNFTEVLKSWRLNCCCGEWTFVASVITEMMCIYDKSHKTCRPAYIPKYS